MGRPATNLVGQIFGRLTVIERAENANDGHARWLCECECGKTTIVNSNVLKKGHTKSCGCLNREVAAQKAKLQYKNLINKHFGRLTAIEYLGSDNKGSVLWKCVCECGNDNFITTSHHLISGNTQSCGCLKSVGESKIAILLSENNIKFIQQQKFNDAIYADTKGQMRFDFYLPDYNRLIEFDGNQHYRASGGWNDENNLALVQQRDKLKNEYALAHSIPLVRIPYWERDNITLDLIMSDKYLVREPGSPIS